MRKNRVIMEKDDTSNKSEICRIRDSVYFYADVDKSTTYELIKQLYKCRKWAKKKNRDHINLYIHSDGGCAYAGLSAMDHLKRFPMPIWTVADGLVCSAATFLLLGGTRRFSLPHSSILIHQVSTELDGNVRELVRDVRYTTDLMKMIERVYKHHTRLSEQAISKKVKKETIMLQEDSIKYGFVEGPPPEEGTSGVHIRWD